jgi:hypothetical protein
MKKIVIPLLISSIVLISCEDQVNPKTDLKDITVLNCIIRGDTSVQTATLSHSYSVSGFDPYENKTDPCIKGADIKIYYNNSAYALKDTSITRVDTGRYNTPFNFYYSNNLAFINSGPISITAILPNRDILHASSFFIDPGDLYIEYKYTSPSGVQFYLPMNSQGDATYKFTWGFLHNVEYSENIYFSTEMIIYYYVLNNGQKVKYSKRVPLYYASTLGNKPIFPEIQKDINYVVYDTAAIRKSLDDISLNDPQKSNYIIEKAVLRILLLDENLAAYYSAQKTFLDEFSIRINQPDFTNITGGVGVFGVYTVKSQDLYFYDNYIQSLGYSTL